MVAKNELSKTLFYLYKNKGIYKNVIPIDL